MARGKSDEISQKQGMILVLLLGLDLQSPRPRTQAEVARILVCTPASISQNTKIIEKMGLICRKPSNDRKCHYYSKGKRFALISKHIDGFIELLNNRYGGSIPTGEKTKLDELFYTLHLSDCGMIFEVIKEGAIEKIHLPDLPKPIPFLDESYNLRGNNLNRTGSVSHNYGLYKIRYQVTDRIRQIYITPIFDIAVTKEMAEDLQQKIDYFLCLSSEFLKVLEKNGWKFVKDEYGTYYPKPLKERSIHMVPAGKIGKLWAEVVGQGGISGDIVWGDRSRGHLELETNDSRIIKYLHSLPEDQENTKKSLDKVNCDINEMESRVKALESRVKALESELKVQRQFINKSPGYDGLDVGSKSDWNFETHWAS